MAKNNKHKTVAENIVAESEAVVKIEEHIQEEMRDEMAHPVDVSKDKTSLFEQLISDFIGFAKNMHLHPSKTPESWMQMRRKELGL